MNLAELLARAENLADLTDDELVELEAALEAAGEDRSDATTDDALAELEQIATAITAVRTEGQGRETATTERQAAAAAALDTIRGEDPGDGEDNSDDASEGDDAEEGAADDGEDAADAGEADADAATDAEAAENQQLAAAARPPRIGRVAARRPASMRPRANAGSSGMASLPALGLVASANLAGFTPGERIDDAEKLATAFWAGVQSTAGYRHGPRVKVPIVRAGSERPQDLGWTEERTLDGNVRMNARKIAAVQSLPSLQASGGICAPAPVQYDLPYLPGVEDRPARDELSVRFGADRGGVVTLPPPVLTDLDGAITVWTEATDTTPGVNTKNCLTVDCPTEDETLVDAIVNCLQFGNFRARFFAEQIEAWMRLAAVNHARRADTKIIQAIGDGSTATTHGQLLGTIPDVLAGLRLASAALRSRHRLGRSFPLRFGMPEWLLDNMAVDEARRLPGTGTLDEKNALAEANIQRWFAAMNVNPTLLHDGESGQVFGAQGDGPLIGWPTTAVGYLYPEGSWLFLDGGTLDLGIVRDSVLNGTNDFQMFSESFEATHFHGVESLRIAFDICPDGSISGTADIDPCSTGS